MKVQTWHDEDKVQIVKFGKLTGSGLKKGVSIGTGSGEKGRRVA